MRIALYNKKMNTEFKNIRTIDIVFRKVYYIYMDEDGAIAELKRRKLPIFVANAIVAFVLPFIAAERLGAVCNFEDIDYGGVEAEFRDSFIFSFIVAMPFMIAAGFLFWYLDFGLWSLVFSSIGWPISGFLAMMCQYYFYPEMDYD